MKKSLVGKFGEHVLLGFLLTGIAACSSGEVDEPPLTAIDQLAAELQICEIPDPTVPSSAFLIEEGPRSKDDGHWMENYWVKFQCKKQCDDWRTCSQAAHEGDDGAVIGHGRDPDTAKRGLAFVVDGMGGHIAYTTDGKSSDKVMFVHQGGGATSFYSGPADLLEKAANVQTVMVRWEQKGFRVPSFFPGEEGFEVGWGWFTRNSDEPATVVQQSRRVASAIAWVHEQFGAANTFGTMACSMGTNATLGPVLWHGLDDIIDYQLFSGGPFFWDVNSACGRRTYERGFCDLDGTTECGSDADCAGVSATAKCRVADTIWEADYELYESVINHTHATSACRIAESLANQDEAFALFDESSYAFSEDADWAIDHPLDIVADIGGIYVDGDVEVPQGDETLLLGHFLPVFDRIESEQKRWHAFEDSLHCEKFETGELSELVIQGMQLDQR